MPSRPDPGRSERLADVYARAERLRHRRRARAATGALLGALALFLVALLVGSNLEVPRQLTTIGRPDVSATTATTEAATTSTTELLADPAPVRSGSMTPPGEDQAPAVVPTTTPPPDLPPTSSPPATAAAPAPTTTTVLPCRNSRDPACGPFRYDPPPPNEPLVVEVAFSPQHPEPGEEVTFTVRVRDDGPARPGDCINQQTYGEPDENTSFCTAVCVPREPQHGPWDPPPPEHTEFEETFGHTYQEAGSYTATFAYNRGDDCTFSPYRSEGEASVTVTVG